MIVVTVDTLVDLLMVVTVVPSDGGSGCSVVVDGNTDVSLGASVVVSVSGYVVGASVM